MGKKEKPKKKVTALVKLAKGDLPVSHLVQISFDNDYLLLEEVTGAFKLKVLNTFKIDASRIISLDVITEKNIIDKQKSVVGRGIAGSILFGDVGLLLGGLSGAGKKQKEISDYFFVISYYGKDNSEIKTLTFETSGSLWFCEELCDYFRENYLKKDLETNNQGEYLL